VRRVLAKCAGSAGERRRLRRWPPSSRAAAASSACSGECQKQNSPTCKGGATAALAGFGKPCTGTCGYHRLPLLATPLGNFSHRYLPIVCGVSARVGSGARVARVCAYRSEAGG
jgi:hypothetical protein